MMGRWLSAFVGLGMLAFGSITFVLGLILGHGMGGSIAIATPPAETAEAGTGAAAATADAAPAGSDAAGGGTSVNVAVQDAEPPAATTTTAATTTAAVTTTAVTTTATTATAEPPAVAAPAATAPADMAPPPVEVAALPPAEPAPSQQAAEPPAVADVRSGPSPQHPPVSRMRGPLLQAATAVPPPEAGLPPPVPVETAGPPSVLSVQVARFLMRENADALAAELAALGYKPQIVLAREPGIPAAPSWYMVTLGPQPDAETANRLAREAAAALGLPAHAVSWPLATE
jgi:hypothetical protein